MYCLVYGLRVTLLAWEPVHLSLIIMQWWGLYLQYFINKIIIINLFISFNIYSCNRSKWYLYYYVWWKDVQMFSNMYGWQDSVVESLSPTFTPLMKYGVHQGTLEWWRLPFLFQEHMLCLRLFKRMNWSDFAVEKHQGLSSIALSQIGLLTFMLYYPIENTTHLNDFIICCGNAVYGGLRCWPPKPWQHCSNLKSSTMIWNEQKSIKRDTQSSEIIIL